MGKQSAERGSGDGVLAPLRVLDLVGEGPTSIATMFLADLGAEVVAVEPGGGGALRDCGLHHAWDRGKRSLVADAEVAEDAALVAELARTADLVVTDASDRIGDTTVEQLCAHNDRLVVVRVSGSHTFPGLEPLPLRAPLVAAASGVMSQQAGVRSGPIYLGHPGIEQATAYVLLISALAALRAAQVSGRGRVADVSMMDGVLALLTMSWQSDRGGSSVQGGGRIDLGRRRLLLDTFECSDGALIMVHTGAAGGFGRALRLLGLDDEIPPDVGPVEMAAELTEAQHASMQARLPGIFRSRTRREWLDAFWSHQLAALPVGDLGDVFDDDQVRYNELVQTVEDPELGTIEIVACPLRIEGGPVPLRGPAPTADADGEALRRDGWRTPRRPAPTRCRALERPLAGVKIGDFGAYFAGPFASRLLADLGAEVVKVEPVTGDAMRPLLDMFEAASRGKTSLAADLKSAEVGPAITRLVSEVDVLCHNLRPGAAERVGIGVERVRELNPDVVYLHAPGYGSSGPKSALQSFAPLHSGMVGIWSEAAGAGNPPMRAFGNEDHYNGLLGACSMLVGLLHRDLTGQGVHLEAPQLHSSVYATSHVIRRDGDVVPTLPRLDRDQYGRGPFDRIYPCASGWLAVCCLTEDERTRLATAVLGEGASTSTEGAPAEELGDVLATMSAADWCVRLAGHPVVEVRDASWEPLVFDDPRLLASGVLADTVHPEWGPIRSIANVFHLGDAVSTPTGRAPLIGEHTEVVLRSLGVAPGAVERWLADGVVRRDLPDTVETR